MEGPSLINDEKEKGENKDEMNNKVEHLGIVNATCLCEATSNQMSFVSI